MDVDKTLNVTCETMKDIRNYSLLKHNTFGIDALCKRFLEYASVNEAKKLVLQLTDDDSPILIIGEGSNLLLQGDYPGTVIHSAVRGIEVKPVENGYLLRCGSGEIFDDVVAYAVSRGYYGMENLSLIPGEVGASAVQNIGAYGAEAKDFIEEIEAVEIATGREVRLANSACEYSYRQSKFKHEWKEKFLITAVTYRLSNVFTPRLDYGNIRTKLAEKKIMQPTAEELRRTIIEIRQEKLPDSKVMGNAGSFFMNPIVDEEKYKQLHTQYPQIPSYQVTEHTYKIPAGWMIEQCGWKGKALGKAGVHDKQALVLVNRGGASGKDIITLCHTIQHDVKERFGIEINPEVNIR